MRPGLFNRELVVLAENRALALARSYVRPTSLFQHTRAVESRSVVLARRSGTIVASGTRVTTVRQGLFRRNAMVAGRRRKKVWQQDYQQPRYQRAKPSKGEDLKNVLEAEVIGEVPGTAKRPLSEAAEVDAYAARAREAGDLTALEAIGGTKKQTVLWPFGFQTVRTIPKQGRSTLSLLIVELEQNAAILTEEEVAVERFLMRLESHYGKPWVDELLNRYAEKYRALGRDPLALAAPKRPTWAERCPKVYAFLKRLFSTKTLKTVAKVAGGVGLFETLWQFGEKYAASFENSKITPGEARESVIRKLTANIDALMIKPVDRLVEILTGHRSVTELPGAVGGWLTETAKSVVSDWLAGEFTIEKLAGYLFNPVDDAKEIVGTTLKDIPEELAVLTREYGKDRPGFDTMVDTIRSAVTSSAFVVVQQKIDALIELKQEHKRAIQDWLRTGSEKALRAVMDWLNAEASEAAENAAKM